MATSSQVPGYDSVRRTSGGAKISGNDQGPADPTNEVGQYPPGGWGAAIFGGTLPTGTGAPGTQGGAGVNDGATLEAGQTVDGLTGLTHADITETGAPGSTGATSPSGGGGDSVTFTRPGSYQSGSYAQDTVQTDLSAPRDSTQANDSGYASGGPKLPGMQEPAPDTGPFQPKAGGRVLRGGRDVRP